MDYGSSNSYLEEPPENIIISEFKILRLIEKNVYSQIYEVIWEKNGQKYALKKEKMRAENAEEMREERQHEREMINLIKSTGCDGIIKVYGETVDSSNFTKYTLMELGEYDIFHDLYKRNYSQNYYSESEIFDMLNQVVDTCAFLENQSIAHRDIKPNNIIFVNGRYKLCDFAEAKRCQKGKCQNEVKGTELYMSPILYQSMLNHSFNCYHDPFKSDVYSLGISFLFIATLDFNILMNFRNIDAFSKNSFIMNCLSNRYSQRFINILSSMLKEDENQRPYFNQLKQMIGYY